MCFSRHFKLGLVRRQVQAFLIWNYFAKKPMRVISIDETSGASPHEESHMHWETLGLLTVANVADKSSFLHLSFKERF